MFWVILLVAVAVAVVCLTKGKKPEPQKPIMPPCFDVYVLGCCGGADCGYWSPDFINRPNGDVDINPNRCYCAYKQQYLKAGSECLFAKEHPEKVRKESVWDDPE